MKHARETAGRHRAEVRPRYGRLSAFGAAIAVTLVAVAGGFGIIPNGGDDPAAATALTSAERKAAESAGTETETPTGTPAQATDEPAADSAREATVKPARKRAAVELDDTALPKDSGSGRRIVFSEGAQRVWLVGADGRVVRTYLASGSVYDNLDPGTYEVFSRSRHAVGVDNSGTMEYFVRFTHGDAGAAIGFHTIPVDDGRPVQTLQQLGTPLSHGCIRQKRSDAVALWEFAPLGTTVVVTP